MDLLRPPELLLNLEAPRIAAFCAAGDLLIFGFADGRVIGLRSDTARTLVDFSTYSRVTSLDSDGWCIAAACADGSVHFKVLEHVLTAPLRWSFADTGIRLSLLPDHSVASGGASGRVVLTRQGFMASLRSKEIFTGGLGAVSGIAAHPSRADVVAWTDDMGLCVYAQGTLRRLALALIDDDDDAGGVQQLSWYDLDSLVVASRTQLCLVDARSMRAMYSFAVEPALLGLVPMGGRDGRMVVVHAEAVELLDSKPGVTLASCALPAPALFAAYEQRWMRTGSGAGELPGSTVHFETGLPIVYVVCGDGKVVFIRRSGMDDALRDAVAAQDFPRALKIARGDGALLPPSSLSLRPAEVADMWLTHLIGEGRFVDAAALLPEVLDATDTGSWARWAAVLLEKRALAPVLASLPVAGLPAAVYETALLQLRQQGDAHAIVALLRKWPATSFDAQRVLDGLNDEGDGGAVVGLDHARALCLARLGRPAEDVFDALLAARATAEVLDMLDASPALWRRVLGTPSQLAQVVRLDEARAVQSLFDCVRDDADIAKRASEVCAELQRFKLSSAALRFLRRVAAAFRSEYVRGSAFEALCDAEVELCAALEPARLSELLRDSKAYSPERALAVCERTPGRVRETVYVLGRVGGPGNVLRALQLLVGELGDLQGALEFAAREGDWEPLVALCQADAARLGELLELGPRMGMDAGRILRAVPAGTEVPRLKQRIEQLFEELRATEAACAGCSKIFRADTSSVVRSGHRMLRRGLKVRVRAGACALCVDRPLSDGALVLFHDGSAYHAACLAAQAQLLRGGDDDLPADWAGGAGSLVRGHCVVYSRRKPSSAASQSSSASV